MAVPWNLNGGVSKVLKPNGGSCSLMKNSREWVLNGRVPAIRGPGYFSKKNEKPYKTNVFWKKTCHSRPTHIFLRVHSAENHPMSGCGKSGRIPSRKAVRTPTARGCLGKNYLKNKAGRPGLEANKTTWTNKTTWKIATTWKIILLLHSRAFIFFK